MIKLNRTLSLVCICTLLFGIFTLMPAMPASAEYADISPTQLFDFSNTADSWNFAWGDYPWYASDAGKDIAVFQNASVDPCTTLASTPDGDGHSLEITYPNTNAGWASNYWFYFGKPAAGKKLQTFDLTGKNTIKFDMYIPNSTALATYNAVYKGNMHAYLFDAYGPCAQGFQLSDLIIGWNTIELRIGESGIDLTKFQSIGICTDSAWRADIIATVNTSYAPFVFNIDNVRAEAVMPKPAKLFDFGNTSVCDYQWYWETGYLNKEVAYHGAMAAAVDTTVYSINNSANSLSLTYWAAYWPTNYWCVLGNQVTGTQGDFRTFDLSEKNVLKFDIYLVDATAVSEYNNYWSSLMHIYLFDNTDSYNSYSGGYSYRMPSGLTQGWNTVVLPLETDSRGSDLSKFKAFGIRVGSTWEACVVERGTDFSFNIDHIRAEFDPSLDADYNNADLSSLAISTEITNLALDPTFNANTTLYSITVPNAVSAVKAAFATDAMYSEVTCKSNGVTANLLDIPLNVGENTVKLTVTAMDESTKKVYTIIVNRKALVTFNMNGGTSSAATQEITAGGNAAAPAAPLKAGHFFEDWYADIELTTAWNFGTDTVSGNTTLYAKWTSKQSLINSLENYLLKNEQIGDINFVDYCGEEPTIIELLELKYSMLNE